MSLKAITIPYTDGPAMETDDPEQITIQLQWVKGDKTYTISTVRVTHNPEYATPTVTVFAPHAGIPLRVYDNEGETVLLDTRKKREEATK
jgi:hypothetical protein